MARGGEEGTLATIRQAFKESRRWQSILVAVVAVIFLAVLVGMLVDGVGVLVDGVSGRREVSLGWFGDLVGCFGPVLLFLMYRIEAAAIFVFILLIGAPSDGDSEG